MTASNFVQPILRRKQRNLDIQDLQGLLTIHWEINQFTLFSRFYTRIDQAFLIWGFICAILFFMAQFVAISWTVQLMVATVLTIAGSLGTVWLTWYWAMVERLKWVVYLWVVLMLLGIGLTNWGLFGGCWQLLMYLCPLWLGLCGIGYLGTAWGLRSRAFAVSGIVHLLGIVSLPYVLQWQYLVTGLISAGTLFLLAETQWDMQSTSNYETLTNEQRQFNQRQEYLRHSTSGAIASNS